MSVTTEPVEEQTAQSEPQLTDHNYDGIQEYDNPLPGWWTWLFIGSFLFAILYVVLFHMGAEGRSIHDQYTNHSADIFELRFAEIGDLEPDKETILHYMNDPEWLTVGKVVYTTHCVSCHGADGGGLVGPNLTEDHWKNVRKIEDIAASGFNLDVVNPNAPIDAHEGTTHHRLEIRLSVRPAQQVEVIVEFTFGLKDAAKTSDRKIGQG